MNWRKVAMSKEFLTAIKDRRTYYEIAKDATTPDARLKEIIAHAVKHTPSAFNSQSARVVLLLGPQHDRLWDITKEALKKVRSRGSVQLHRGEDQRIS
jgi:predicted oxidoreductase (fatty acid repression mutant protein)